MSSIARIKDALDHREPDRVPLDIGGTRVSGIHEIAYQKFRQSLGLAASQPRELIRYLRLPKIEDDFRSLIGVDLESVDPFTTTEETAYSQDQTGEFYTDRWQSEWFRPTGGHYFDVRTFPLANAQTPADVEKHLWPNQDSENILANIVPDAKHTWFKKQRAVVLGRTCPGIFEMPAILCGHEKAMMDIALNPALTEAIMDKILELKLIYYKVAIEKLLSTGVEYFIIEESDDLGAQRGLLISLDMYRKFVKPRHSKLFSEIKKYSKGRAYIGLHCCGAIRDILPDLIESGVEILNPVQVSAEGMGDTKSLKRDFGDSIVFHGGGVDTQNILASKTPGEIRDEVHRRIDDLSPDGGFIFTPVHSIQHDVPFGNFMAMLEAFQEFT